MKIGLSSFLVGFIIFLQASDSDAKQPIKLAIVLDDIGYKHSDLQALTLPAAITLSILPYTPYAKKIATVALQQQREILLHVPMQAKQHNEKLGKGALLLDMQEADFKAELNSALNYLPAATGINNHMGSALTEHVKEMQWTMEVLGSHGLYFLDSRTTAKTIAENTAKLANIPALHRHVFLDNIKTNEAMEKQFLAALTLGKKGNGVVIIAHPYPETLQFLASKFKQPNRQIELVALKMLFSTSERLAMTKKRNQLRQVNNTIGSDAVNVQNKQLQ
ncbi:hypothetical protein GCM10007916_35610 [Psychromonas marina]|uniref:Divergent polysaccharide deacetylase family protein n=1 Tax=Psychromonas marina TaxID=88364 RepID=A0ABQ6E4Z9_9GAMM|nr:divergent polysaccharide deacetylase family protein [Psychromonas marina]GLS92489.1 hypothetical protein GCM10007916_35610 [Psychromonas marina]